MVRTCLWSLRLPAAFFALSCSSSEPAAPAAPELPACPPDGATAPTELRCTGLFSDWKTKKLAVEASPFKPGAELWSDGAEKLRYALIPKGTKIDTTNPDDWVFPVGTKTWKEFRVGGKRIETRFYWKVSASQWAWATYLWSPDESRAERDDKGKPEAANNYDVPSVESCDKCHAGAKDKVLGIQALLTSLPEAQGLTLAKLKADGLLSADVTVPPIPEDATGKARAALTYLHVNCGAACHDSASYSPGLQSGLFMKLNMAELALGKVSELGAYKTTVGREVFGNAYFEYKAKGFLRIKPGVAAESLLPELAKVRGPQIQMPPVGSRQPDPAGRGLVEAWINALPPN